ncbi:hypothetical protein [Streptacidiphilus cavernicola]|uniref:Secreted protein n=1 Tax=Streptacidiphilus cavernicola TaxID=3342716 RepID=A0ABV6W1X1_9ACTN
MKHPRRSLGQLARSGRTARVAAVVGAAFVAVVLAASPSAAAYLRCDAIRVILKDCIGSDGGAEVDSCQPEVDTLALAVGPQPTQRAAACLCLHDIEEQELHSNPNRDIAALNRRLGGAGLYSWNCALLVTGTAPGGR